MGLNATAYSKVGKRLANVKSDNDGKYARLYVKDHPQRAGRFKTGYYPFEEETPAIDMSYSGYNSFREDLAQLAGYPAKEREVGYPPRKQMRHDMGAWEADGGPFWELIDFSDCEGTLGTEVCQKLAKDFADFQEKAEQFGDDRFFLPAYNKLRAAVELAADGGAIRFS